MTADFGVLPVFQGQVFPVPPLARLASRYDQDPCHPNSKRTSELLLTTPSLTALRKHYPDAHITLAADSSAREFLPAFNFVDDTYIFSRKDGNRAFWGKLLFASFDICLDYTGNDRSATCSVLSKAKRRIAVESGSKSPLQSIFYSEFVRSSARETHAADHYLDLLQALKITSH